MRPGCASQRVLLPEGSRIADNVFVKANGGVSLESPEHDSAPPLDSFHFQPNRFEGNVVSGGEVRLTPMARQGSDSLEDRGRQRRFTETAASGSGGSTVVPFGRGAVTPKKTPGEL